MKSFLASFFFIVLFFFCLLFFTAKPVSHVQGNEDERPLQNPIAVQKQAEAIQKQSLSVVKSAIRQPKLSNVAFQTYLKTAVKSLPTFDQVRDAAKNSHDTPEIILNAGALIGGVADQMKNDANNIQPGLNFFKFCAQNESIVESIRAVCLRTLVDISSKYRNNVRVTFADYPDDIQRMARHIPRLR